MLFLNLLSYFWPQVSLEAVLVDTTPLQDLSNYFNIKVTKVRKMPALPCIQTLQRELADSIIRCAPLDDIRILLACGAKVNEPVTQGTFWKLAKHKFECKLLCREG